MTTEWNLESPKVHNWGTWSTPENGSVKMLRRGCKVRFYDENDTQVGAEHANVAPAMCFAAYNGWWDESAPAWLNVGMILEVRANTRGEAI